MSVEQERNIIECKNVSKTFQTPSGPFQVIGDFSLTAREHEFVALFGPGQCGKSTIINLIAGLETVTSGQVIVNGKTVKGPGPERGVVFQNICLFPWLTTMGNVEYGLKVAGVPKKERRARAQKYIDLVGLHGFENSFPIQLSGGMKQRVGIARSYCIEPKVLLMDEPFGALDAQTRYLMQQELDRIWQTDRRTIVFVTNNIEEALYLADRIVVISNCPATVKKEYVPNFWRCGKRLRVSWTRPCKGGRTMELGKETREVKVHVDNLTKRFGDLLVLDQISFDVYKGELLCVVGPTGCGKTTFLNCLTHIYDLTAGQILMDGKPVNAKTSNIAYIFQGDSTMPWLTVAQNVAFGLNIKHTPPKQRDELVDKYLDIVGLTKFRNYYPKQLSSSMLQRVSIARAFATEPELLLMDEPYGQLDIELRFKLEDELVKLWEMTGTTVIFITHNIEEAVYLGQRIMILTNKPTTVKETVDNNMPRPRDIAAPEFIDLRNRVTERIKWW